MNRWFNKDKTPNATAIAQDMVFLKKAGVIGSEIATKTVNQVLEQRLRSEKNSSDDSSARGDVNLGPTDQDIWGKFFHIPAAKA